MIADIEGRSLRRLYPLACGLVLAVAASASVRALLAARRAPLAFDDAYMFLRYAHNVRHGLGYSWNLDGAHTYGPTSLLWGFVTLLLSYLPVDPWTQLLTGSWLCSVAAVLAMAWAVASNARSTALLSMLRVLPLVVLPLAGTTFFQANQFNGMETMLAMALCACFAGAALLWSRGRASAATVGLLGFLLFLARPESALVGVLVPALLWLWPEDGRRPAKDLVVLYAVLLGGIALQMTVCQAYFGTPVPLSVYMKGKRAYAGYRGVWHPELLLAAFVAGCEIFVAALVLLARRGDRRLLGALCLPAFTVFLYLQTVTQIMGFNARYYAPYLPLIVIPSLLVLDRRMQDGQIPAGSGMRWRSMAAGALILGLLVMSSEAVQGRLRLAEHRGRDEYDAAQLTVAARQPLPRIDWQPMMAMLTDTLVAPLPRGVTVAATEVGYLGERAAEVNVIDLAGLNDTEIALHGFRMGDLMRRKPDLIWMPNTDYTFQRGEMFADPALLANYDVYADAANYGLAVRKDSPFQAAINARLRVFWAAMYPGTQPEDYRVSAASWAGGKHMVWGE